MNTFRSSDRPVRGLLVTFLLLATFAGCATSPVGVKRMDAVDVHRAMTANALTEDIPSIDSANVLHQRGLYQHFQKNPEWALAQLHRVAVGENNDDVWFALAELSFLHSERTHERKYSVMAAIYAWAYLFGGDPVEPFDPRLRTATDLYNRGLTQGLEQGKKNQLGVLGQTIKLPIGDITVAFDESTLIWNGRRLQDFVPVAELKVTGLNSRFRTPGIGAPLAASAVPIPPGSDADMLAPRLRTPVTALVRIPDSRKQIANGHIHATLDLYTDPNEEAVVIDGQTVPLEKEPTAALASMVAEAPVIKTEIAAFLGKLSFAPEKGLLVSLRPHVRGRIPVVYVHGTASSPARWAEMVNTLDNDPRLNGTYEPWFFAYNSSSPIVYSSSLLRKALVHAVNTLDPDGTDPGMHEMVVIGHSQGGLLTKMTAVHSGNRFWENVSEKPFAEVKMNKETRTLMSEAMFVEPLPFVSRVIFICTPHRGSFLAAINLVRTLITKLITLPVTVTQVTANLMTLNPELAAMAASRGFNAVDNMAPSNPFVVTLSQIPVTPEVTANSIVAVKPGDEPIESGDDGVVKYTSAHIDGVESEFVVRSTHSTQGVPATIEEVRRILLLHEQNYRLEAGSGNGNVAEPKPESGTEGSVTSKSR